MLIPNLKQIFSRNHRLCKTRSEDKRICIQKTMITDHKIGHFGCLSFQIPQFPKIFKQPKPPYRENCRIRQDPKWSDNFKKIFQPNIGVMNTLHTYEYEFMAYVLILSELLSIQPAMYSLFIQICAFIHVLTRILGFCIQVHNLKSENMR